MQELKLTEEVEEVPLDVMFAGILNENVVTMITRITRLCRLVEIAKHVCLAYCRMDPLSDSMGLQLLPLSQSDKWLASAKILDMRKLTTTDTGLCFFKFRKRAISFEEYLMYLEDLAETKSLNIEDMKLAMQRCGKPVHPSDINKKKK